MDISNSECIKNKQNTEMFKFFEKTRNRKPSRTSQKSNKKAKPTTFRLPMRRTTRLKSEIFVESCPEVLPDGEFDISKDFSSTMSKYEPLKKKIKLSNADLGMENEQYNEITESLNGTSPLINSTIESNDPDIPQKRGRKQKISQFEKMADNMIETIDTNIIIEMLKNTSLDKEEDVAESEMTKTSERTITQNCDTNLNSPPDSSDRTKSGIISKQLKKRGGRSIPEKLNQSNIDNVLEDQIADYQTKQTHNSDPQISLNQTENSDTNTKTENVSKQSKTRGRKSIGEKFNQSNIENELTSKKSEYETKQTHDLDTNPQIPLSQTENIDSNLNNPLNRLTNNDNDCTDSDISKQSKKRGRKSNFEKIKQSNVEDKPGDNKPGYQTNDSQISLTTNGDNDLKNADQTSELPKKRGRKPKSLNVEKLKHSNVKDKPEDHQAEYQMKQTHDSDLENILHDNDSQISLTTNGDNDLQIAAKPSKQPKKRGRKPKSLNNTLLADISGKQTGILKYFKSNTPTKKINTLATENSETLLDNVKNDSIDISDNISEQRSQKSNTTNIADTSLTKSKLNTSANTEPKKRGRPKSDKPRVVKVNVAREFQKRPFTKISKLTKDQIKNGSIRKIPKKRLDDVLEMIDDEDHPIWQERNISCNTYIYDHWEPRSVSISDQNMKLKYARQFLLRRDWIGLSKVLYLSNTEAKTYYPLLSKYATLLLAHTDKEQFNKCIQFLTNMNDSSAVMKKCTKISKENED